MYVTSMSMCRCRSSACRTRHKRACEVVACEARTLTTEICAYLPKLPRAKPRTSSRPQQSCAHIGRLGWQTSPSRPAVSTRPRLRLLTAAPRGSRQSATFVRGFMDVMVVACATASHAAPVLRMSTPTQSRSPSCASAARGRYNRAGMSHWQAVTWTFAVCASLIVGTSPHSSPHTRE